MSLGFRVGRIRHVVLSFENQASHGGFCQRPTALKISPGNEVAIGMGVQPAGAMTQKFSDFIFSNVVMLLIVEDWEQDIEVTQ